MLTDAEKQEVRDLLRTVALDMDRASRTADFIIPDAQRVNIQNAATRVRKLASKI